MKTIEELITSLEVCANSDSCDGCAYYDAHKDLTEGMNCDEYAIPEMMKDALFYLKEQKEILDYTDLLPDYYALIKLWEKKHHEDNSNGVETL